MDRAVEIWEVDCMGREVTHRIRLHPGEKRAMLDADPHLLPVEVAGGEELTAFGKILAKIEVRGLIALLRPRVVLSVSDNDERWLIEVHVRTVEAGVGRECGFCRRGVIPFQHWSSRPVPDEVYEAYVHEWFFRFMQSLLSHELAESLSVDQRHIVNPHPFRTTANKGQEYE